MDRMVYRAGFNFKKIKTEMAQPSQMAMGLEAVNMIMFHQMKNSTQ